MKVVMTHFCYLLHHGFYVIIFSVSSYQVLSEECVLNVTCFVSFNNPVRHTIFSTFYREKNLWSVHSSGKLRK